MHCWSLHPRLHGIASSGDCMIVIITHTTVVAAPANRKMQPANFAIRIGKLVIRTGNQVNGPADRPIEWLKREIQTAETVKPNGQTGKSKNEQTGKSIVISFRC